MRLKWHKKEEIPFKDIPDSELSSLGLSDRLVVLWLNNGNLAVAHYIPEWDDVFASCYFVDFSSEVDCIPMDCFQFWGYLHEVKELLGDPHDSFKAL